MKTNQGSREKNGPQTIYEDGKLLCPICQSDRVHMEDITVILTNHWKVDGHVIVLPGHYKSGHRFSLCFGQHNGHIFLWANEFARGGTKQGALEI